MRFLIIFLLALSTILMTSVCFAGEVLYPTLDNPKGIVIHFDDRFSGKDYTDKLCPNILNNITVYASCFSKEIPDTKVFPDTMKGVTFVNCNLDDVYIPSGNTIIGGSQLRFKVQNDLRGWEVDKDDKPIKVLNEEFWISEGYSVDPKDMPMVKQKSWEETRKVK